ncbi:MAG: zinc ribbon domain-containing protein [Planctomycetota bacterium]
MPLYEYLCRDCDHEVEVLVRNTDEQPECPDCGSAKLMKLLSVPAAHSASGQSAGGPPEGPCGSACGCFPGG